MQLIEVPKSTFYTLNKMISLFVWQRKRPRIRLKTLQLSKPNGELEVPNVRLSLWAAQLRPLISWMRDLIHTQWVNIEKSLHPIPLNVIPFFDKS